MDIHTGGDEFYWESQGYGSGIFLYCALLASKGYKWDNLSSRLSKMPKFFLSNNLSLGIY